MKTVVLVFAVALLLLFGCSGGTDGTSSAKGAGAGSGANGGNNNGGSGGSGASSGAGGGTGGSGGSGASGFDIAASTMSQIINANVPAVCELTPSGADPSASVKVYMKGENLRYEVRQEVNGKPGDSLMIKRGDTLYFEVAEDQKATLSGCDWLTFPINDSQSVQSGNMNPADLRTMPKTSYSCAPAAFGNEKFETPGKGCDYMQMLEEQMQKALEEGG